MHVSAAPVRPPMSSAVRSVLTLAESTTTFLRLLRASAASSTAELSPVRLRFAKIPSHPPALACELCLESCAAFGPLKRSLPMRSKNWSRLWRTASASSCRSSWSRALSAAPQLPASQLSPGQTPARPVLRLGGGAGCRRSTAPCR
eukprot:1580463-Rhodomonas_salina.1